MVSAFDYRDMKAPEPVVEEECSEAAPEPPPEPEEPKEEIRHEPQGVPQQEVDALVKQAVASAVTATESRLRAEFQAALAQETAKVSKALDSFFEDRKGYFERIETEVVKLSLSIASRILHREAQVDPLLLVALVRVAIENLAEGSKVTVRVAPGQGGKWTAEFAALKNKSLVTVHEEPGMSPADCILETEIGTADFSVDAQLGEIQKGFFDLLAQRPS